MAQNLKQQAENLHRETFEAAQQVFLAYRSALTVQPQAGKTATPKPSNPVNSSEGAAKAASRSAKPEQPLKPEPSPKPSPAQQDFESKASNTVHGGQGLAGRTRKKRRIGVVSE